MPLDPADARIRDLLAAGDVSGAATLSIRTFGPDVLRYLRAVLRDEDDAADAFSRFAENVWKDLPGVALSSFRPWAFRIAWSAARRLRNERWRRRRRRLQTGEASGLAEEIRTNTVVRVARQEEALDVLRRALSLEEQSLLTLRLDQGFSWAQVAEILSQRGTPVSPATLMKKYERIKRRLRRLAEEHGIVGERSMPPSPEGGRAKSRTHS